MLLPIIIMILGLIILENIYNFVRRNRHTIQFKDRLVWITGASQGIGKALAFHLSHLGADLILTARNVEQLEQVKKNCRKKSNIYIVPMDLSDPETSAQITKDFLQQLENQGKFVNIMIHNAGQTMRSRFLNFSYQNHIQLMNLNYNTPYIMTQLIIKHIKKNHQFERNSKQIVIVSSEASKISPALRSSYAGAKAAMNSLYHSIQIELQQAGLKITQIIPGFIQTDISKNAAVGDAGKTYGQMDEDNQKGMPLFDFAIEALKSIYLEEQECIIDKNRFSPLLCSLRAILPDLLFFITKKYYKLQQKRFPSPEV